jgi:hypothetical protein
MNALKGSLPSNRKFGLTIGAICIFLFLFGPVKFSNIAVAWLGLVLILTALFIPAILSLPNKAWMKLGDLLHQFTNPIFMLLLYIVVFCPIGLTLKLIKQFSAEKNYNNLSYWVKKTKYHQLDSMKNQF